jgi:hypothetical protein
MNASVYHPTFAEIYVFNIEPEVEAPHAIDNRIASTVVHILKEFFSHEERAIIIVCDNSDGKEKKREKLFSKWFIRYNDGTLIKCDASIETEDYILYVSMMLKESNPQRTALIAAFYEVVGNSFCPME